MIKNSVLLSLVMSLVLTYLFVKVFDKFLVSYNDDQHFVIDTNCDSIYRIYIGLLTTLIYLLCVSRR